MNYENPIFIVNVEPKILRSRRENPTKKHVCIVYVSCMYVLKRRGKKDENTNNAVLNCPKPLIKGNVKTNPIIFPI